MLKSTNFCQKYKKVLYLQSFSCYNNVTESFLGMVIGIGKYPSIYLFEGNKI